MVDEDLLLRKLADIEQYLGQMAEYREVSVEEYQGDWKIQRIVERTLHLAIESSLDVASHVVADRGLRVPATYADTFVTLCEAGLLAEDLRDAMVRMTGFRNVIVHEYTRVDPAIVIRILRHGLNDLERFVRGARAWT